MFREQDSAPKSPGRERLLCRLAEALRRAEASGDSTQHCWTSQRSAVAGQQWRRDEGQQWHQHGVVSSGIAALDRRLPGGGFCRGALVEWLSFGRASAAGTLAVATASRAAGGGGAVVVVDRARRFYAPAVIGLGIDAGSLILLRPRNTADEMWAVDQALRTCGVAAVVWWGGRLEAVHFRRLQLGCQRSGALGLFVRPAAMRGEPSWADIRLLVRPLPLNLKSAASNLWPGNAKSTGGQVKAPPWRATRGTRIVRIEILRCRSGSGSGAVEVEIDDETGVPREAGPGPLAAELAPAAAAQREARA